MPENLLGKINCYDICPHNHNCFGCFLNEDPLADKAIEEVKKRFNRKPVNFWPKNNVGLVFVSNDERYLLDHGELKQI